MPNVAAYGRKRKLVKRRKFVARKRRDINKPNAGGSLGFTGKPYQGLSRSLVARSPWAPQLRGVTMAYADYHTLTTGTALYGSHIQYRMNSVFDPYYTGAGHSVHEYSRLAAIYNRYRVDKCHWSFTFTTPGDTRDIVCTVSVSPNSSAPLTGETNYVPLEWANAKHGLLSPSGARQCVVSGSTDLATLNGVPKFKFISDDLYMATVGTSPAALNLLSAAIICADGTGSIAVQCVVNIVYEVTWFDRITN